MNKLTRDTLMKRSLSVHGNRNRVTHWYQIQQRLSSSMVRTNQISIVICLIIVGLMLLILPLSSRAVISATTSQTIQGSAPYFIFNDEGSTKIDPLGYLLWIRYLSVDNEMLNASYEDRFTELTVHAEMKENELEVRPLGVWQSFNKNIDGVSLNETLKTTGSLLKVEDADGDATNNSAAGTVSITLYKNGAKAEPTSNTFDPCSSYQLKVVVGPDTEGLLLAKTQYGSPSRSASYTKREFTYTIKPNAPNPYVCYVQPNLDWKNGIYAGAVEWDSTKGFLPISTTVYPTTNSTGKNFPTTGFNYAYFNLKLAGVTAKQVIDATATSTPTTSENGEIIGIYNPGGTSGVTLELTATDAATNVLKVTLRGPNNSDAATAPKHVATLFDLKSSATNSIYRFKIDKWFIARYDVDSSYNGTNSALVYCSTLGNGENKYRLPSIVDYTNGNGEGWNGGLSGQGNTYKRAIGGGLFAEWGYTRRDATSYPSSDFENNYYWVSESVNNDSAKQYNVNSYNGYIGYSYPSNNNSGRAACVSP